MALAGSAPVKKVNPERVFVQKRFEQGFRSSYVGAFAATDIYCTLSIPYVERPIPLGTLAAISISTHRDAFPVTNMYNVDPRGFTQGHRTTAGTLIFHTIDRNAFFLGRNDPNGQREREAFNGNRFKGLPHPDTLPLFDIHISYINEEGAASFESVLGIRLLDFGKTMSFENLHPMESYSFMAIEYSPMRNAVSDNSNDLPKVFQINRQPNRDSTTLQNLGQNRKLSLDFDHFTPENVDGIDAGDLDLTNNIG